MNAVAPTSRISPVEQFVEQVLPADRKQLLFAGLPSHINPGTFERNLANAIMANPGLMRYDARLVFREVSKAAGLGLLLDPQLQEAYIIEAWNSKTRQKEPQLRVGYRGMTKLARQSGLIENIYAHEVHANDFIDAELGMQKRLVHKPVLFSDRGPVIGYYAVAKFKDGEDDFEPMSVAEIHAIRDRSDAYKAFKEGKISSTPWSTDDVEMSKKTVIRRLVKRLPQSPEMARAISFEDEAEHMIEGRLASPNANKPLPPPPGQQQIARQPAATPVDETPYTELDNGETFDQETGEVTQQQEQEKPQETKPAEAKVEPQQRKRKPNGWPALFEAAKLVIEDGVFTKDESDPTNVGMQAADGDHADADLILTNGVITKQPGSEPAFDVDAAMSKFKRDFEAADSIDALHAARDANKEPYLKLKAMNLQVPANNLFREAEARIMEADRLAAAEEQAATADAGEADDEGFPGDPGYKAPAGKVDNTTAVNQPLKAAETKADAPEGEPTDPNEMGAAQYEAYARHYLTTSTDLDVLKKTWYGEDAIRTKLGLSEALRKQLRGLFNEQMADIRGE